MEAKIQEIEKEEQEIIKIQKQKIAGRLSIPEENKNNHKNITVSSLSPV